MLEPDAGEALRLAALTHDMERHFPGGPQQDPTTTPPDDPAYRTASTRSARPRIVGEWLRGAGADEELVEEVEALVLLHEVGGDRRADLLQAADSLSFLEVNVGSRGRAGSGTGAADRSGRELRQPDWMFEPDRARRARASSPEPLLRGGPWP